MIELLKITFFLINNDLFQDACSYIKYMTTDRSDLKYLSTYLVDNASHKTSYFEKPYKSNYYFFK